jgi:hypothetical protein
MSDLLLFTNNASSTLASPITSIATSLTLVTGGGTLFPVPSAGQVFIATIISQSNPNTFEIIKCTAVSGDSFTTIVRAREGTTAQSWDAGDYVNLQVTAGSLNQFAAETSSVQSVSGGTNITVDNTDPQNPVVTAPGVALLSGAAFTGNVSVSGTITSTGAANFYTSSLERKSNARPIPLDTDRFMLIEPIAYNDIPTGLQSDGFSAENIAKLYPELVMFKDGKPYAVNYGGMIAQAVVTIQHLKERIDELENLLLQVRH